MKPIKTIVAACLAAVALSVGAYRSAPAARARREVVRQGVADELERLKTHDEALLDELAADSGVDQLATYGIDAKSFIAAYLDGFDYRIDEVKVDGDNATATVVLTCKKFDAFAQALTEATTALAEDGQTAELDADQINEKVGQLVLEALGSVEPTESNPVELPFARTDNAWGRRAEPSRRCLPRCSQVESASSAAVTFRILHGNRYERFGAFGLRNGIVCAMDTVGSLQGGIMGYVVSLLCFLGVLGCVSLVRRLA